MWLVLLVLPVAILVLVGGLVVGGVYAFVLVPIAVIIAATVLIFGLWTRANRRSDIPSEAERVHPLPHTGHANTAAAPSTPDQLTDARRGAQ